MKQRVRSELQGASERSELDFESAQRVSMSDSFVFFGHPTSSSAQKTQGMGTWKQGMSFVSKGVSLTLCTPGSSEVCLFLVV